MAMMSETKVSWQDYVAIVLRRRWFFLTPLMLVVAISMVVGLFMPKIYRAETIMLVQDQNVVNPLIQGLAVSTSVGERLRTLREELLSWTSLSRLVHEMGMDEQARSPSEFERLIKRLQQDISVRMRGGNVITIGYEDEDPKVAQKLVNSITTIYMERNVASQDSEAETAITFIEKEMTVYKQKLEAAERSLREFKELYVMQMPVATQLNSQLIDMEVLLAQMLVENTENHPRVLDLRRRIADLKKNRNAEIRRVLASALAKGADSQLYQDLLDALEAPAEDTTKLSQQQRMAREAYVAWIDRLDNPASVTGPQAQAPTQVVVAAPQAGGEGSGATQSVEIMSGSSTLLSLGPRQDQELMRLTRDYQVYQQTYQHLQNRLEKAKVTQRLGQSEEGTKFKILEPARLPLWPVRPNMLKIFGFSLILGVFLGAGVAFLAEYLDQSFQNADEVQEALELPVIGSISTIVTEDDLVNRRKRRKGWFSPTRQIQTVRTRVVNPVWATVDRALVRWKL